MGMPTAKIFDRKCENQKVSTGISKALGIDRKFQKQKGSTGNDNSKIIKGQLKKRRAKSVVQCADKVRIKKIPANWAFVLSLV